jgi:hypothetical protein
VVLRGGVADDDRPDDMSEEAVMSLLNLKGKTSFKFQSQSEREDQLQVSESVVERSSSWKL